MTRPRWMALRSSTALGFALVAGAFSLLPVQEAEASACSSQGTVLCYITYQCSATGCREVSRTYYSNGEITEIPSGGATENDVR